MNKGGSQHRTAMEKRVSFDILFPAVRRLIDRLMVLALLGSICVVCVASAAAVLLAGG